MLHPLAISMPGMTEWIIIGVVALLLFGKRLPEVGRSLGKGIVEFKRGLKGIEDEVDQAAAAEPPAAPPQASLPPQQSAKPLTQEPSQQRNA